MKKTICNKCNNEFSNNNFKKHYNSCDGTYNKFNKSTKCKYCNKSWKSLNLGNVSGDTANHIRWCKLNPNYDKYITDLKKRIIINNSALQIGRKRSGALNQYVKAKLEGNTIISPLKGKPHPNPFKKHTKESKEKIRKAALNSKHRRLRKGIIEYNGILLESSWELELAKRLDILNIKWERPNPLTWVDNKGLSHNYFPDFYLIDYDLYLDPKNPAAYLNQIEKIKILQTTYKNIKFLRTLDECKNFKP